MKLQNVVSRSTNPNMQTNTACPVREVAMKHKNSQEISLKKQEKKENDR